MGFVNGRCKLVLTMRGNPDAQTALEGFDPTLVNLLREAMTAHEIGHCWRYVHGEWHTLPAGFTDSGAALSDAAPTAAARHAMRQTRREEAFADLVGLAWIAARHPAHYAFVHAWFVDVRDEPTLPGSHHDTVAWLRLAPGRSVFDPALSPFEQALRLWREGLLAED
jgi:ADP-ribose pyrophosphatase YjhB (NUDIX family)